MNDPSTWSGDVSGELTVQAPSHSDFLVDPTTGSIVATAPFLYCSAPAAFTMTCFVRCDFRALYDSAVLMLYFDESHWAKLCYEYTPWHVPSIVSVVTDGRSDDCNGPQADANGVWLRIARNGEGAVGMYFRSRPGGWRTHRLFYFPSPPDQVESPDRPLRAGLVTQCPTGNSCTATFDNFELQPSAPNDLRIPESR